jgi:membrane protease YdiL (CAAX protease family)
MRPPSDRSHPRGLSATSTSAPHHFASRFALALIAGLIAAAILSPFVAWGLAVAGWHFPFPRIFDRTMMVTLLIGLLLAARRLDLGGLLREGFTRPLAHRREFALGLALSLGVIAILFAFAAIAGCGHLLPLLPLIGRALKYTAAAILIGVIEEAFFRAFLLAGLRSDYGWRVALSASALVYAAVHVLRSPAHIYLSGYYPLAGFQNLALSAARFTHPTEMLPVLIGLFLLGIVLGQAFMLTGKVYCSIGLHAGFVIGAKTWPLVVDHLAVPRWLAGPGPVPLIAAPAAWVAAIIIAVALPLIFNPGADSDLTARSAKSRFG